MSDYQSLIERVEGLSGPNFALECEIYNALTCRAKTLARGWKAPPILSSMDAAVALVERKLPGWTWVIHKTGYVHLMDDDHFIEADHSNVVIALILALLRALQSQEPSP